MKTKRYKLRLLLFLGLLAAFAVAGSADVNAQARGDRDELRRVRSMRRLPDGHERLRVDGRRFFYGDGYFFRRSNRGFAITAAPLGAVVGRLPERTRVRGNRYYQHNGVYFKKIKRGYRVIAPPRWADTGWAERRSTPIIAFDLPGFYFSTGIFYRYSKANEAYVLAYGKGGRNRASFDRGAKRFTENRGRLAAPRGSTSDQGRRADSRRTRLSGD